VSRAGLTVVCVAVLVVVGASGCAVLDLPDQMRARRARSRIQKNMTLTETLGVLETTGKSGEWPGFLAGFGCSIRGQNRTWVMSRVARGYLVITHLEDAPFGGQGDWKEFRFPDAAAAAGFLSDADTSRCSGYRSNFGRWFLPLRVRNGRVKGVETAEYEAAD
jgi:hypothetical protein